MRRLAADENFNHDIIRGLLRRRPDVDIRLAQDAGLLGVDDPSILAWAAAEGRVLLTHDRATMPDHAFDRVKLGERLPGVIVVSNRISIGQAVSDVLLLAMCSRADEWEGQVVYVPL